MLVSLKELEAMLCMLPSKSQKKPSLNIILIELYEDTYALTATNGHKLGMIRPVDKEKVKNGYTIHGDEVKRILSLAKDYLKNLFKVHKPLLCLQIDFVNAEAIFKLNNEIEQVLSTHKIELRAPGQFPDYRSAVAKARRNKTKEPNNNLIYFDISLFSSFHDVAKILSDNKEYKAVKISDLESEGFTIKIESYPDFQGVLMQMRNI